MALFRVTVKGKLWGQDVQNVVHFFKEGATQADMAVLAQRVSERFIGAFVGIVSSTFNWFNIIVEHINPNPWVPISFPVNQNGTFFSSTQSWGPMCVVFQLKTPVAGRKGRGRIYVSGFYGNDLQNGVWSPAQQVRNQGAANSLKQWFTGTNPQSTFSMALTSRTDPQGDLKLVTDIVPRAYPGSQVRRNLFRGN